MRRLRLLPILLLLAGAAPGQDEDGLARLWAQQAAVTNEPAAAAGAAAAALAYADARPADPLAPAARSLAGWQLLRAGKREQAAAAFAAQLEPGTNLLGRLSAQLARAWMTRLDRERVKDALQFFYRKEVRYPYSLLELRNDQRVPAALAWPERDRWDEAWRYRLVGFKNLPGLQDQKYELLSASLGADSDLKAALAVPCGERIALRPVRVRTTAVAGREVVEFARTGAGGGTVLLTAGQASDDGLLLAYLGFRIVIVADRFHWRPLPRPEGP